MFYSDAELWCLGWNQLTVFQVNTVAYSIMPVKNAGDGLIHISSRVLMAGFHIDKCCLSAQLNIWLTT